MTIDANALKKIHSFINMLKIDSPIFFSKSENGVAVIEGKGGFSSFIINTNIQWDFPVDGFCLTLPNISFMEDDVTIVYVPETESIIFGNKTTKVVVITVKDPVYDMKKQDDLVIHSISTKDLDFILYLFKTLNKSVIAGSDSYTAGIYVDNENLFSTDRITACWYKGSLFDNLNKGIVIDASIVPFLEKIGTFAVSNFKMFVTEYNKVHTNFEADGMVFMSSHSLLNINYPDFNRVFSNYSYDAVICVDKETIDSCLQNIMKFDNRISGAYFVLNNDDGIEVSGGSNDNSKNINTFIPFDYEEGRLERKTFKVLPNALRTHLGEGDDVYIHLSAEANKPLMVIDNNFKYFIQTMVY